MKKTIIGSVFMLSGVIITISLIISAALYAPNINTWSGSKLWFAIFGAKDSPNTQSLSVGVPFIIGLVFLIAGLLILINEYSNN